MSRLTILILCAFVLSCKSTKTATFTNESERSAAVQAQWRSAQNLSFSGIQRLTALSFDSCAFTFGVPGKPETPQGDAISYPSGKPQKSNKAKPSTSKATPSKVTLYGLHLSQKVEEKSSMYQSEADSLAKAMQSSYDKSQSSTKSRTSVPFTAKLAIAVLFLLMAAAIIYLIRRVRSAKRTSFGSRLTPQ